MGKKITKVEDVNRPIEIVVNKNKKPLEVSTEFLLKPSFLAAKIIDSDKKQLSKDLIDLQYTKDFLEKSVGRIKNGNLADIEEILFTQACALNVMFSTLIVRANRQEFMPSTQALMNLAFKAQNLSRATLHELIEIKQPSQTTFVKQANITRGHQQVNNFDGKKINSENELLRRDHAELDARREGETEEINTGLEALAEIYRCKDT